MTATMAEFYRRLFDGLRSLGIEAAINTKPFALNDEYTLDENTFHGIEAFRTHPPAGKAATLGRNNRWLT